MSRIAFTLRIDTEARKALESLSQLEGRPVNQILNEAVRGYLNRQGRRETAIEANLEALRAYRQRDPSFENAIHAFVDAESTLKDPLEGSATEGRIVAGQLQPAGPVQSKIRELLRA